MPRAENLGGAINLRDYNFHDAPLVPSSVKLNVMSVLLSLNTILLASVGFFINEWRAGLERKLELTEQHLSGLSSSVQSLSISIAILQEADKRILDIVLSKRHRDSGEL